MAYPVYFGPSIAGLFPTCTGNLGIVSLFFIEYALPLILKGVCASFDSFNSCRIYSSFSLHKDST